jgi:hypothetical protein
MKTLRLGLLAVTLGSAAADSLYYTTTPTSGGFTYDFTLTNTGDTGGTLFDLFLSIPLDISDIDTTTIGAPVGWGDPTGGLLFFGPDVSPSTSFIEWASDASGLYDVTIGNSLSGFSFISSQSVAGSLTFALNGSTTFDVAQPAATIPEPSAFVFCCTSLGLLFASGRWRRLPDRRLVKIPTAAEWSPVEGQPVERP